MSDRTELWEKDDPRRLVPASDSVTLAVKGNANDKADILQGSQARTGWWHVLEARSTTGLPFDVVVEWSGAASANLRVEITATGGSCRFSFWAMNIQVVKVTNLSTTTPGNPVRVSISTVPGPVTTSNRRVHTDILNVATPFPVPPYATRVRVDVDQAARYAASTIQLIDGSAAICAETTLALQPGEGLPCAGMSTVNVTPDIAGHRFKIDFELGV